MKTLVIAKKVVIELIRDKRTVLLMFVAPLLILCLLNLMFSASTKTKVTIGTVDVNNQINRKMDQVDGITVKKYESEKHAKKDLDANSLDGVISYKSKQYDVTYANLDVSKTVMTKKVLESALMKDNVSKLQSMVVKQGQVIAKLTGQQESVKMNKSKISIKNHYNYGNSKTNFFDKMAPILIGFFVFFFVFLISGMALLKERISGTLERLLATPVKRSEIVYGYMLGYGLMALAQASLITVVGIKLLDIEIIGSIFSVIIIAILLGFVALAFGILLSTFASSEFQMMQFIPLVVVPQIFFSGIIPLDSMADWAQRIGKILPLTYAGEALSAIIMQGADLIDVGKDILVLIIFLVVLLILNILGLKRYRKV